MTAWQSIKTYPRALFWSIIFSLAIIMGGYNSASLGRSVRGAGLLDTVWCVIWRWIPGQGQLPNPAKYPKLCLHRHRRLPGRLLLRDYRPEPRHTRCANRGIRNHLLPILRGEPPCSAPRLYVVKRVVQRLHRFHHHLYRRALPRSFSAAISQRICVCAGSWASSSQRA